MDTLMKADVFFFISTIAIVVAVVVLVIAGFYVIQILRNFRDVSLDVKKTVATARGDLATIRKKVTSNSLLNSILGKKGRTKRGGVAKS